jgi:hypothetical protein
MKVHKLSDFIKGWFIGDFTPTLFQTNQVEVSIKRYTSGDYETMHHHKIATEFTVIISGTVKMNNQTFSQDDIIQIDPGESADFYVVEDTVTCVVKLPSVKNDKYLNKK